jgi:aldose 1-epimerase
VIALTAGDWRATLAPEQGGAVLSLDWRDQPVFRPTPDGATDMLETACFPLVPYANRIADGRFTFEGRSVELPALERFAPHALHGDGWLLPWTVDSQRANEVEMTLYWPGGTDGWPWPWRARQTVELTAQGLTITLSVTNTGAAVMPAGLGLHPYFHRRGDSCLTLSAEGVWITDSRGRAPPRGPRGPRGGGGGGAGGGSSPPPPAPAPPGGRGARRPRTGRAAWPWPMLLSSTTHTPAGLARPFWTATVER